MADAGMGGGPGSEGGANDAAAAVGGPGDTGNEGNQSGDNFSFTAKPTETKEDDPFAGVFDGLASAANEALAAQEAAAAQANAILEASKAEALSLLARGEDKAAQAIIENSRRAAREVLVASGLAEDAVREFWGEANASLAPLIERGNYADDEIASMLGIPNAAGEVVPFDLEKLRQTPGFQHQFNEGQRSLANSAVGNALSGAQAKAAIEFGSGLASLYFNDRVSQLSTLGQTGANAAQTRASLATTTGGQLSQIHQNRGATLANIYTNRGNSLANIHTTTAANSSNAVVGIGGQQASVYTGLGEVQAGIITGLATAQADITLAQIANRQALNAQAQSAANARADRRSGAGAALGTAVGTAFGGPIGGAIGGFIGGSIF